MTSYKKRIEEFFYLTSDIEIFDEENGQVLFFGARSYAARWLHRTEGWMTKMIKTYGNRFSIQTINEHLINMSKSNQGQKYFFTYVVDYE